MNNENFVYNRFSHRFPHFGRHCYFAFWTICSKCPQYVNMSNCQYVKIVNMSKCQICPQYEQYIHLTPQYFMQPKQMITKTTSSIECRSLEYKSKSNIFYWSKCHHIFVALINEKSRNGIGQKFLQLFKKYSGSYFSNICSKCCIKELNNEIRCLNFTCIPIDKLII